MAKFNKGDKVKFIGDPEFLEHGFVSEMDAFVNQGAVGTITLTHDTVVIVSTEGTSSWNYGPHEVALTQGINDPVCATLPVVEVKLTPELVEGGVGVAEEDLVVDKQVYAVADSAGNIKLLTADREVARATKSGMGGKKAGIVIIAYAAVKEIR